MPNKQAAKKYLRKANKLMVKNSKDKKIIKDLQKRIEKAVVAKETAKLVELMKSYQQKVDKAIKSGWLKKNTGNRKKSRLSARVRKAVTK